MAKKLSEYYSCEVLHLDSIHFASDWLERTDEDMIAAVKLFLKKESWIIEGNHSRIFYSQRMEEADQIIILTFNRLSCLWRAYRRYRTYKGRTRPDMATGCNEKFDWEFVRWILWDGRSKRAKNRYCNVRVTYQNKTIILKNQHQLDCFINALK